MFYKLFFVGVYCFLFENTATLNACCVLCMLNAVCAASYFLNF